MSSFDDGRQIVEIINNDFLYRGEIKNNMFDGFGEIYTKDYEYFGEFKDGYMHGDGVCKFKSNNCTYDGNFYKSLKNGYGKVILFDRTIIEGIFCNDKLNKALVRYPNKEVLECIFINGLINGIARSIFPNGDIVEKEYKDSKIIRTLRKEKLSMNQYSVAESLLAIGK
tara:strand:+ start:103 stop:609 length:507 start_codon:yes stop_codon:yes gene_type:complete